MKTRFMLTLPLAASLILPAMAQQTPADSNQTTGTSSSTTQTAQNPNSDQNMSAHQPLQPDMRQGFWGKINPFARKKYVQRQLSPIRNRVNELDDLSAANAKAIKDVDARAQEGIRQASARADQADQHALDAGNRAQQANQTAQQASTRLTTVEQVVGNIDQYQPATQTEIRFRPGQTMLSKNAKQALDDMAANLKSQRGYIVEVQGFAPGRGQAAIQTSQAMADAVVRYLVLNHEVPVYRIFVMGMGNAPVQASTEGATRKNTRGGRVEVSLLKNNVDQLASANQPMSDMGSQSQPATGQSTGSSYSQPTQPQTQPNQVPR